MKIDTLEGVDIGMLLAALQADNPIERIAFRQENSIANKASRRNLNKVITQEMKTNMKDGFSQNPKVGFKCLHYVISESCGSLEIKIAKKVNEEVAFMVQCVDGTAIAGKKYISPNKEVITMSASQQEHIVKIEIIDDEEYNEDLDFTVELVTEQGIRMEGDDTQAKVTIKDEDLPGTICFDKRKITVRKMDKFAYIQLTRKDGAAGDIQCYCKTDSVAKEVNN